MNEKEKEVLELLQHCQNTYIEDTLVTHLQLTTEEAKILLNLIEKQQKEIEEKEKVIDEMAKQLVDLPIPISQEENVLFFNSWDVKKFFYKKIEKK